MLDLRDPEDLRIRNILIGTGAAAVLSFLGVAVAVAAMVGANFNFLNWME